MRARRERVREWFSDQNVVSLTVGAVGASALALLIVGSLTLILWNGIIPFESLLDSITSRTQSVILWVSVWLGVAGVVGGTLTYRRMPTKASRNAAVAGGVLGGQAILFSALYLWFRAGDTEIFVRNFLQFEKFEDLTSEFLRGAMNTVILATSAEVLGIAIGMVLALFVLSKRPSIRAPARLYINVIRGTPLVWQLAFFSLVMIIGFGIFRRNPYPIAIIILGLNAGGYSAEIFRAGIQSIERGQFEAARSLGFSYLKAMRYAIIPQAIRRVIPPLTNEFVILIKDTSLVFVLGLTFAQRELLAVGRDAYSTTFNATPFLGSALGYLAVTIPMIRVVNWLEKRLRSGLIGVGA